MPGNIIKGVAVADLHIGIDNVGGLNDEGTPARVDDFFLSLDKTIEHAIENEVDLFVIAGDLTKGRNPPMRIVAPLVRRLYDLASEDIAVLMVRGNHDGDGRAGWPSLMTVLDVGGGPINAFENPGRLDIWLPKKGRLLRTIGVPWPSFRHLVGDHPVMSLEELTRAADAALREEIQDLAEAGRQEGPTLFVGHLSVAGADRASDQWMTLGWEPALTPEDFPDVFDLVILGHYHRGCRFPGERPMIYCGSLNTIDFGEEGQDKMFWSFELGPDGHAEVEPVKVKDRPFRTLAVDLGPLDLRVRDKSLLPDDVQDAVVRVRIKAATPGLAAGVDLLVMERWLREHGAWWVHSIEVKGPEDAAKRAFGERLETMAPEALLDRYLKDAGIADGRRELALTEGRRIMGEEVME